MSLRRSPDKTSKIKITFSLGRYFLNFFRMYKIVGKSEELPEEEIEKMLDEDLPPELKEARKPKEKPYVTRTKIVLEGIFQIMSHI